MLKVFVDFDKGKEKKRNRFPKPFKFGEQTKLPNQA
jgi:hypothetical protein